MIYRRSQAVANGTCGPGCGFSSDADYKGRMSNYIVMTDFNPAHILMPAHECRHYLALGTREDFSQRNMMAYGDHQTNLIGSQPNRITIDQGQIDWMRPVLERRRLLGLGAMVSRQNQATTCEPRAC